MNKWQLFDAIGRVDLKYLEETEEKQEKGRSIRKLDAVADSIYDKKEKTGSGNMTWLKWAALAACICLVVGLLRPLWPLMGGGYTSEAPDTATGVESAPAEEPMAAETGSDGCGQFTSYEGPVLPLTAVEGGQELEISRDISLEIDSVLHFSDQYTLENPTDEDITFTAAYPFVGSLSELAVPCAYVDGEAADAQLHCGPYSGWFTSVSADQDQRWNIARAEGFEDYRSLLEDGSYAEMAFVGNYDLSQPVTIYCFETTGTNEQHAATIAVSMNLNSDTTVLTYGFNGWSRDDNGDTTVSYFISEGSKLRMMLVLGQDIGDFTLQGYENGACEPGTELDEISAEWTRQETTLGEALMAIAGEHQVYDQELFTEALADMLLNYGALADHPAERYTDGYMDMLVNDTKSVDRVFYQTVEVTVPAGGSVTLTFEGEKEPSFNYYDTGDVTLRGYELATTLGSSLSFVRQTALLETARDLVVEQDDFGFDLDADSSEVTLDVNRDRYGLVIRD